MVSALMLEALVVVDVVAAVVVVEACVCVCEFVYLAELQCNKSNGASKGASRHMYSEWRSVTCQVTIECTKQSHTN